MIITENYEKSLLKKPVNNCLKIHRFQHFKIDFIIVTLFEMYTKKVSSYH